MKEVVLVPDWQRDERGAADQPERCGDDHEQKTSRFAARTGELGEVALQGAEPEKGEAEAEPTGQAIMTRSAWSTPPSPASAMAAPPDPVANS